MSTEAALMSCCYPDWPHQEASYSLQPSAEATPCHARVVLMLMLHRDDKSPSLAVLVAGSSTADFPVSWPCWSRLSWDVTMSFCLGQLLLSISFPFFGLQYACRHMLAEGIIPWPTYYRISLSQGATLKPQNGVAVLVVKMFLQSVAVFLLCVQGQLNFVCLVWGQWFSLRL